MITANQKKLINDKDEDRQRTLISILKTGHHPQKEELIEYLELCLDRPSVGDALVEMSEPSDGFDG